MQGSARRRILVVISAVATVLLAYWLLRSGTLESDSSAFEEAGRFLSERARRKG